MPTYTQIGSAVVVGSGGASSIDFTSIPATYTDLVIVGSLRCTASGGSSEIVLIQFNGSSANLSDRMIYGTGTAVASINSSTQVRGWINANVATANTFGSIAYYIPNYAGSTYKSISIDSTGEVNDPANISALTAGLWSNTAAITSFTLVPAGGTWMQYSTAYLYGVSNA
jgi:hypothetical protein